jgi:hypothetical protein
VSKFASIIIGGLEIIAAVAIVVASGGIGAIAVGSMTALILSALVTSGAGMLLSGLGTLLSSATATPGVTFASRNPVKAWDICYGQCAVGGTIVFINEFGSNDKYLDMVIVLAAHEIQSVDRLLFDKQQVQLSRNDGSGNPGPFVTIGNSFTPTQQVVAIASIVRAQGVVTVTTKTSGGDIPLLLDGDQVWISNVTAVSGKPLNGKYKIFNPIHYPATPSYMTFQYLCGGLDTTLGPGGQVNTVWPNYGNNIYMEVLLGNQTSTFIGMTSGTPNGGDLNDIITNPVNPWTADHILQGKACAMIRMTYNQQAFSGGIPSISFLIHGKNNITDPRGPVGYTENAALCIADYLMNTTYGFAATYQTEVPTAPLITAANHCDEAVPLADGSTEPRYSCNGHFDLSLGRGRILQNLLTSCAGKITYSAGQWIIWPGVWYGATPYPAPTMGQMAGPMRWKPTVSLRDLYNGVKGMYVSPDNDWQPGDIPPYAQDSTHGYTLGPPVSGLSSWSSTFNYLSGDQTTYDGYGYVALTNSIGQEPDTSPSAWEQHYQDINLSQDLNIRRWLDIQLPFTISSSMAQRICKIELLRRRQFGTGTLSFNLAGYAMAVLDVIQVTIPFFGWGNSPNPPKTLEVTALRFTSTEQTVPGGSAPVIMLGVSADVQETDSSVYDWNPIEELTAQGYQQAVLPSTYNPAPPTNVELESDYSTTVVVNGAIHDTVLVSWTAPADGYVLQGGHIEIEYQQYYATVTQGTVSIDRLGNATFSDPVLVYAYISATLTVKSASPPLIFTITAISGTSTATVTPSPTNAVTSADYILEPHPPWTGLTSINPGVTQVVIGGVVDGISYIVQIRAVNAALVASEWVPAGPIVASGAHAPWCLIPGAVTDGHDFETLGLTQRTNSSDLLVDITSTTPVNSFSPTLLAPDTSAATEAVTTGGALPAGNYAAVLYGIDANGLYSLASAIATFTVPSGGNGQFTWTGVIWDPNSIGYDVFCGPDIYHMGSVYGKPQIASPPAAPSANITIQGSSGAGASYGAPDPKFDHFRLRMRWAANLGVVGCSVNSATLTNIVVDLAGMTVNEFANRTLFHIGTAMNGAGDATDQAINYSVVESNDATSFTVTTPEGGYFNVNDVLVVIAEANINSDTTIGDALFINSQSAGLTPDGLIGYHVIIWEGPGAGQERNITGNTATTLTIDPAWEINPSGAAGNVSTFFIVASTYSYDLPTMSIANTQATAKSVIGTIPITAYQNQEMIFEIATVDANNNFSSLGAPIRPCWVFAVPVRTVGPGAGPFAVAISDQVIRVDTSANDVTITLPRLGDYQGGLLVFNIGPNNTIIATTGGDVFPDGTQQYTLSTAGGTARITSGAIYTT